jgi:hypothetical protein
MAAALPTSEPTRIRAGETLAFTKSLADYAANDSPAWVLTYSFRAKPGDAIDFSSTASGADHLINVAFTTTALWAAGTYYGVGMVSNGVECYTVWEGQLVVYPNLAEQDEDFDPRTQAKRTLDNINATIEGRASSTILNSEVEGIKLERIPISELLLLKDRYEVIVANEERAAGIRRNRTVFATFTNPR